jgi:26S proteasome regulatory subunit N1
LVDIIVPFYVSHNAESEACDLLLEVERIEQIKGYLDKDNFQRVCRYLASFAQFVPEPEVSCAFLLFSRHGIVKRFPLLAQ